MEWNLIRLDEYCDSVRDGTHDTPKPTENGYPLVTSKAIRGGKVYLDECYLISPKDFEKINKRSLVERWDVLMTMIGTVGRLLLVKDKPCYAIKNIALFKVGNELKAKWLYYYLKMSSVQNYFEMIANGTSQHFIGLGHMRKLKIPNITMSSKKVTSILSTYDTLIENNTKRIRLLEKMAENLYKEWFVRFRFPGHEKVEMENGLPKGWKIKRIKDYGKIETGKTPSMQNPDYYGGDYLFIKTPDMHERIFVSSTEDTLSDLGNKSQRRKLLPPYSIMVSCIGTGGVVAINAKAGHTNQQINSIILENGENLEWLYFTCKSLKSTIELFGATGATMTNLSKGKFEKLKVLEPTEDLRMKFHNKVGALFKIILNMDNQNTLLARQRDLLLPRLMSGKLEV